MQHRINMPAWVRVRAAGESLSAISIVPKGKDDRKQNIYYATRAYRKSVNTHNTAYCKYKQSSQDLLHNFSLYVDRSRGCQVIA